jgi:hypothetical protein
MTARWDVMVMRWVPPEPPAPLQEDSLTIPLSEDTVEKNSQSNIVHLRRSKDEKIVLTFDNVTKKGGIPGGGLTVMERRQR